MLDVVVCQSIKLPLIKYIFLTMISFKKVYVQVAIITPFNFPLEIPVLQLMGALYMGNKPVLKVDGKVSALSILRNSLYCQFVDIT